MGCFSPLTGIGLISTYEDLDYGDRIVVFQSLNRDWINFYAGSSGTSRAIRFQSLNRDWINFYGRIRFGGCASARAVSVP